MQEHATAVINATSLLKRLPDGGFTLDSFDDDDTLPILSHTWTEVTYLARTTLGTEILKPQGSVSSYRTYASPLLLISYSPTTLTDLSRIGH